MKDRKGEFLSNFYEHIQWDPMSTTEDLFARFDDLCRRRGGAHPSQPYVTGTTSSTPQHLTGLAIIAIAIAL